MAIYVNLCYHSTFVSTKFGWDDTYVSILQNESMEKPDDFKKFASADAAAYCDCEVFGVVSM